jgi:hypothetical protein
MNLLENSSHSWLWQIEQDGMVLNWSLTALNNRHSDFLHAFSCISGMWSSRWFHVPHWTRSIEFCNQLHDGVIPRHITIKCLRKLLCITIIDLPSVNHSTQVTQCCTPRRSILNSRLLAILSPIYVLQVITLHPLSLCRHSYYLQTDSFSCLWRTLCMKNFHNFFMSSDGCISLWLHPQI